MTDDDTPPPKIDPTEPDDSATASPDHELPSVLEIMAFPSQTIPPEPAPSPAKMSAWQPAPLEPRPPWRPATPPGMEAPVQTFDTNPPSEPPAPPPTASAGAGADPWAFVVDPDHFAIAETEEDDGEPLQDRGLTWLARLFGAQGELDESSAARAARTLGWTSRTILFAAITLLVLNARSIETWASTLPPQWGSETLRLVSAEWAERTKAIGLDEPRRRVHAAYQTSKTLSWDGTVTQAK